MNSLIFKTTAHIISGLMLIFSIFLLFRGHHEPGGGFIGALIAVIALGLLMMAESPAYVYQRLKIRPITLGFLGLLIAGLAGLFGWASGMPYLTGIWWKEFFSLGTPLIFDVGVYLAVLGGVLHILMHLDWECE